MRILIAGASGLIGSALARALLRRGHAVVEASRQPQDRPGAPGVRVDFARPPHAAWWAPHLEGIDVVVNAVGIFREDARSSFAAVHSQAPLALFGAAAVAGVRLVVQISALGSDAGAQTLFHLSKREADEGLRQLPVRSVIVQPSLVYSPLGASATLFNQLALLPVLAVPGVVHPIQPVHLDDLVDALIHMVEQPPAQMRITVAAVGPEALTLKAYLLALRRALGLGPPLLWAEIPFPWIAAALRWAAVGMPFPRGWADALRMLARGNHADAAAFSRYLGRQPAAVQEFLPGRDQAIARDHAWLQTSLLLMKCAVAMVWIATGVLSLGLYPVAASLGLLGDFGLFGPPALAALYLGALLDIALGMAVFVVPSRWMGRLWRTQLLVIVGYTVLITLRMPQWWLHPFGPILKNLPLLVAIGMLAGVARRA